MKKGWLQVPGWPYRVNPETLEVVNRCRNTLPLKKSAEDTVKLHKNGRKRVFSVSTLLKAALEEVPPEKLIEGNCQAMKRKALPWAIMHELDIPNSTERHFVRLVEGPQVHQLGSYFGIPWSSPEMLGVDAPFLPNSQHLSQHTYPNRFLKSRQDGKRM